MDTQATLRQAISMDRRMCRDSEVLMAVKELSKPSLLPTLGTCLYFYAHVVIAGLLVFFISSTESPFYKVAGYIVAVIIAGRAYRGIEGMMHEASHFRWSRNKAVNDLLGNIFTAYPFGKSLREYRGPHYDHHSLLMDKNKDDDLIHYMKMGYGGMRRGNIFLFIVDVLLRIPMLYKIFFAGIFSSVERLMGVAIFHVIPMMISLVFFDINDVLFWWLLIYIIPYFFVCFFLRVIGEAEEHIYNIADIGIMKTTYNNNSVFQRLFVHPAGDNYHVIHHLFPGVLQIYQPKIHRLLSKRSEFYRNNVMSRNTLVG